MADVIEVIHKINYEVNDAALHNVTNVVRTQISEIGRLTTALNNFQRQLNNTRNINALDELNRKIDHTTGQIQVKLGQTKGFINQFGSGLLKGLGIETDIEGITAKFFKPLGDHLFTIDGKSKDTAKSLGGVAAGITSFTSLAPAAIGMAINLATELIKMANATSAADVAHKKFIDRLKQNTTDTKGKIANSISQVEFYQNAYNSANTENKAALLDVLKKMHPGAFANVNTHGKTGKEINSIIEQLKGDITNNLTLEGVENGYIELNNRRSELTRNIAAMKIEADALHDKWQQTSLYDRTNRTQKLYKSYEQARDQLKSLESQLRFIDGFKKEVEKRVGNLKLQAPKNEVDAPSFNIPKFTINQPQPEPEQPSYKLPAYAGDASDPIRPPDSPPPIDTSASDRLKEQIAQAKKEEEQASKDARDKELQRIAEVKQGRKDATKDFIAGVQEMIGAVNALLEAQVQALDKEIDLRKERVDAATKLAERGNTEALRFEEQKLAEAQKKREETAQKQLQLNALIQASNQALALSEAIGAVVGAAAKGDPYTIAIRIAAAVAALVAGIATIKGAFKDGVVDFQGKGTGTSDSNVVRISHGESVITAAGTQRNKEVLEAINRGAVFNMLQPNIKPMYMPAATQGMAGYASRGELKGLEKKMDTLIDTVAANGTTVHARMDERGMSLMTVKQIRREHNRFK